MTALGAVACRKRSLGAFVALLKIPGPARQAG